MSGSQAGLGVYPNKIGKASGEWKHDKFYIPFMPSISGEKKNLVRLIIEGRTADVCVALKHLYGVNINFRDEDKVTPLMHALLKGEHEVVMRLIDSGAHLRVKDCARRTILMYAVRGGNMENVTLLAERGINNFTDKDDDEVTTLMYASWGGNYEIVKHIFSKPSVHINAINKHGETALMYSMLAKYRGSVSETSAVALIDNNADVNIAASNGQTALMCAARFGGPHMLVAAGRLIEAGANRYAINEDGRTAEYFAKSNGHHSIARLLSK